MAIQAKMAIVSEVFMGCGLDENYFPSGTMGKSSVRKGVAGKVTDPVLL